MEFVVPKHLKNDTWYGNSSITVRTIMLPARQTKNDLARWADVEPGSRDFFPSLEPVHHYLIVAFHAILLLCTAVPII